MERCDEGTEFVLLLAHERANECGLRSHGKNVLSALSVRGLSVRGCGLWVRADCDASLQKLAFSGVSEFRVKP